MRMSGLPLHVLRNEEKVGVRKTHSASLQSLFHSRPTSTPVGSACVFVYCLVSGKCQLAPRHTLGSVCLLHTAGQESRFSKCYFFVGTSP